MLCLGTLLGISVNGLGRACFSPYGIACGARRPPGNPGVIFPHHHRLAVLTYPLRSGFRYGLTQYSGFDILHCGAIRIGDPIHHVRLVIIASVDQGTVPGNHLNHGHVKALSERIGEQVRGGHMIRVQNQGGCPGLSLQVNIGPESEVESLLELGKTIYADGLCLLHQRHIAGPGDGILHAYVSVSPGIMALDLVTAAHQKSVALIDLAAVQNAGLQPHGCSEGFGSGPRLVSIADTEVLPQVVQIHVQHGVIHLRNAFRRHILLGLVALRVHHHAADQGIRIAGVI